MVVEEEYRLYATHPLNIDKDPSRNVRGRHSRGIGRKKSHEAKKTLNLNFDANKVQCQPGQSLPILLDARGKIRNNTTHRLTLGIKDINPLPFSLEHSFSANQRALF